MQGRKCYCKFYLPSREEREEINDLKIGATRELEEEPKDTNDLNQKPNRSILKVRGLNR
jgi:hypothetical protein